MSGLENERPGRADKVGVSCILADFTNVRRGALGRAEVGSLVRSIEENGLFTRPLVRPHPEREGCYQLILGHRRMAAVGLLGWQNVEVEVREGISDSEARAMQMQENLERASLSPVEEAGGIKRMIVLDGQSQREVGQKIGMDPSEVRRRLNLLKLSELVQGQLHSGALTAAHGNVLFKHLEDREEPQALFAGRAVREKLSAEVLESYIKEYLAETEGEEEEPLVEECFPNMDPTPTVVAEFRGEVLPAEGEESGATGGQRDLYVRLAAVAALMAFNDQELRDELGLTLPAFPADVDAMYRYVQALSSGRAEALLFRQARRFFAAAGHRKHLISGSIIGELMYERPSDAPASERAGF